MKYDIIARKLRRELEFLPIDSEPRTAYLFVEIRKVLEHENVHNLLRFYCDWVVHTRLDKAWARRVYGVLRKGDAESASVLSFRQLRDELKAFLRRLRLPTQVIEDDDLWNSLKRNLVEVLIDTPLSVGGGTFSYKRRTKKGVAYRFVDAAGIETAGVIDD